MTQDSNLIDPARLTVTMSVLHDAASGDVFLPLPQGLVALGNTDGRIYFTRLTRLNENGNYNVPTDSPAGWVLGLPEGQLADPQLIATRSLALNSNISDNPAPMDLSVGQVLNTVSDTYIPILQESKATGMEVVMRMTDALLRSYQSDLSVNELRSVLEMSLAFFSAMPEEVLTARIVTQEEMDKPQLYVPERGVCKGLSADQVSNILKDEA